LALVAWHYKRAVKFLTHRKIGRIVVILWAIWFVDAYILYWVEHKNNDNYANILVSGWSGLVNLMNFGSKEPFTNTGRVTSTVMTVLWVAGIACLTAQLAASFVGYELRGKRRMKDHYIIVNWNNKGDEIVRQLRSPDVKRRNITIVGDSQLAERKETPEDKSIRFILGNPTDEVILEKAGICEAYSVLILADGDKDGNVADAKNVMILLAIKNKCRDKHIPIVLEIVEPNNAAMMTNLVGKDSVQVEVISTKYLGAHLFAQAVVSPGVSKVYDDLLSFDETIKGKSNEIYKSSIPGKLKGHLFKKLLVFALEADLNVIPCAICDEHNMIVNPLGSERRLQDGDYYFAIAERQDDLAGLNKYIEKHGG
jgi:Trk K+ transport system NAD-binding subunit